MAMTDYWEAKILGLLKGVSVTGVTVYAALFTSATTEGSTGTEVVSGSGYARKTATFSAVTQNAGMGQISNTAVIDYGVATGNWGTITNVALFDAPTGGNMLYHEALQTSKSIEAGDSLKFDIGQMIVRQS